MFIFYLQLNELKIESLANFMVKSLTQMCRRGKQPENHNKLNLFLLKKSIYISENHKLLCNINGAILLNAVIGDNAINACRVAFSHVWLLSMQLYKHWLRCIVGCVLYNDNVKVYTWKKPSMKTETEYCKTTIVSLNITSLRHTIQS